VAGLLWFKRSGYGSAQYLGFSGGTWESVTEQWYWAAGTAEDAAAEIISHYSSSTAEQLHHGSCKSWQIYWWWVNHDVNHRKHIMAVYPGQSFWDHVIISPAGVVAKYCNEHVCVSVCLSATISPEPNARSLPNVLCMLPIAIAWSSSRVTKSQGKGQFRWFSSPIDKALGSIAFGTHTRTAEPIEMPFGLMTRVGAP